MTFWHALTLPFTKFVAYSLQLVGLSAFGTSSDPAAADFEKLPTS
jgi:hypothetical protein